MQQFPFLACRERDILQLTSNVDDTNGCMKLGQSMSMKITFSKETNHLYYPHAAFPFSCIQKKGHHTSHSGPHKWMTPRGVWCWGFKLDHLGFMKPTFSKEISNLLTIHMQHFPFLASREKCIPQWTSKVNEIKGVHDSRTFKLNNLGQQNLFLKSKSSVSFTSHVQHFPFPACTAMVGELP